MTEASGSPESVDVERELYAGRLSLVVAEPVPDDSRNSYGTDLVCLQQVLYFW